jgi:hypothetical protein
MKLIVSELKSTLLQMIEVGGRNLDVTAIRPHLILYGSAAGSLTLQIEDETGQVVGVSETLSISGIRAAIASLGYDHGFTRFYINATLRAGSTYGIRLIGSGYTFSEVAWAGWCIGYDQPKVAAIYVPSGGWSSALDMELWGNKKMIRRAG